MVKKKRESKRKREGKEKDIWSRLIEKKKW